MRDRSRQLTRSGLLAATGVIVAVLTAVLLSVGGASGASDPPVRTIGADVPDQLAALIASGNVGPGADVPSVTSRIGEATGSEGAWSVYRTSTLSGQPPVTISLDQTPRTSVVPGPLHFDCVADGPFSLCGNIGAIGESGMIFVASAGQEVASVRLKDGTMLESTQTGEYIVGVIPEPIVNGFLSARPTVLDVTAFREDGVPVGTDSLIIPPFAEPPPCPTSGCGVDVPGRVDE